jgi:hypothetical protein
MLGNSKATDQRELLKPVHNRARLLRASAETFAREPTRDSVGAVLIVLYKPPSRRGRPLALLRKPIEKGRPILLRGSIPRPDESPQPVCISLSVRAANLYKSGHGRRVWSLDQILEFLVWDVGDHFRAP